MLAHFAFNGNAGEMGQALAKCGKLDNIFENVLATVNLPAMADLGMQQDSGNGNHQ